MQHVSKKTSLGIALQQSIHQCGLEKEEFKIMQIFHKTFMEKFQTFKATVQSSMQSLKGVNMAENEFPIGDDDKQQYFRAIVYQSKLGNIHLFGNGNQPIRRNYTLIQGYSKNEDPKKRKIDKQKEQSKINKKDDKSTTSKKNGSISDKTQILSEKSSNGTAVKKMKKIIKKF